LLREGEFEAVAAQATLVNDCQMTPGPTREPMYYAWWRIPRVLNKLIEHILGVPEGAQFGRILSERMTPRLKHRP
jgi:hypothetical protein